MSDIREEPSDTPVSVGELRTMAAQIPNNKVFRKFLKANKAENRRAIYDALSPWLHFKPRPFFLING